jgi:hypothetical protein
MPKKLDVEDITIRVCKLLRAGNNWTVIAEAVGVGRRTLQEWRNSQSPKYQPVFAEAVSQVYDDYADGIKHGQFELARKHTLIKTTRILRPIDVRTKGMKVKRDPPKMPPSAFRRREIIEYADRFLDLELDPTFTINEMRIECQARIEELTIEVMQKIKEEPQECDPNQQAVKNVLQNCGQLDERWTFKEELEHEIKPKTIADIAAAMGIGGDSGR